MLIPVNYHKRVYPKHIHPEICEVAGHFDVERISDNGRFSLHTEYSYGKRNLSSQLLSGLSVIRWAAKKGVPQLWLSEKWALEFISFIRALCKDNIPDIIEIHPPFTDYTLSVQNFIKIYKVFESEILDIYPNTHILLENRSGSTYSIGKFLISKGEDLRNLSEHIALHNLRLKITLDLPQLLTSYGGPQNLPLESLSTVLNSQNEMATFVKGIHLWGKKKSKKGRVVSHCGDLTSYFEDDDKKQLFLTWLSKFLNDGVERYFVPEVNSSNEDLESIVNDLEKNDIKIG